MVQVRSDVRDHRVEKEEEGLFRFLPQGFAQFLGDPVHETFGPALIGRQVLMQRAGRHPPEAEQPRSVGTELPVDDQRGNDSARQGKPACRAGCLERGDAGFLRFREEREDSAVWEHHFPVRQNRVDRVDFQALEIVDHGRSSEPSSRRAEEESTRYYPMLKQARSRFILSDEAAIYW